MFETIGEKMRGKVDDRGVSPVIGVILMVAITVILAAVIAAFVLDLGSGMEENPRASVSFSTVSSTDVAVTLSNNDNIDPSTLTASGCLGSNVDLSSISSTGDSQTVDVSSCSSGEEMTVTARPSGGGNSGVIGTYTVE